MRKREDNEEEELARLTSVTGVPKTPQGWWTSALAILAMVIIIILLWQA